MAFKHAAYGFCFDIPDLKTNEYGNNEVMWENAYSYPLVLCASSKIFSVRTKAYTPDEQISLDTVN
jgi:hypothetical protein